MTEQQSVQPQLNLENLVHLVRIFPNSEVYSRTLTSVFTDYPVEMLSSIEAEGLERVLRVIANRHDVRQLRHTLEQELASGEDNLRKLAWSIFNRHIKGKVNVPLARGNQPKVYDKEYQEVRASCASCSSKVALGLFHPPELPLEAIVFKPEHTLYAKNLDGIFPDLNLTCDSCGSTSFTYSRDGLYLVLREQNTPEERKRIVKDIIRTIREEIHRKTGRSYTDIEKEIIGRFFRLYTSIKKDERPNGEIQYDKLYKLFEWIKRENLQIGQLHLSTITGEILKDLINDRIQLPYAVMKMRVKTLESIYGKMMAVAYGMKKEDNTPKELRDIFALRIILPTIDDCYILCKGIIDDKAEFEIDPNKPEEFKDYIKEPKKTNGYRSIHLHPTHRDSGIKYSLQIRTHQMDRATETDPKQIHDDVYAPEKVKIIVSTIPYQVRRVFAAILGIDKSPLLVPS